MNDLLSLIDRAPQICFTQINANEIIILNLLDGNFYHLNESAVDLWLSLETAKTILNLTQILAEKYAGLRETYEQDVIDWLEDNKSKGLLSF